MGSGSLLLSIFQPLSRRSLAQAATDGRRASRGDRLAGNRESGAMLETDRPAREGSSPRQRPGARSALIGVRPVRLGGPAAQQPVRARIRHRRDRGHIRQSGIWCRSASISPTGCRSALQVVPGGGFAARPGTAHAPPPRVFRRSGSLICYEAIFSESSGRSEVGPAGLAGECHERRLVRQFQRSPPAPRGGRGCVRSEDGAAAACGRRTREFRPASTARGRETRPPLDLLTTGILPVPLTSALPIARSIRRESACFCYRCAKWTGVNRRIR